MLGSVLLLLTGSGCASVTGNAVLCDIGPYPYFGHEPADRWGDAYNASYEVVCE